MPARKPPPCIVAESWDEVVRLREMLVAEQVELHRLLVLDPHCHAVHVQRAYVATCAESLADALEGRTTRFERNAMASAIREAFIKDLAEYVISRCWSPPRTIIRQGDVAWLGVVHDIPEPVGPLQ